jgi:NADH-quinone oxidoreductase subunit E
MANETIYSHPFSKSSEMWPHGLVAPFSQSMTPLFPVSPANINLIAPAVGAAAAMAAVGVGVAACAWGSVVGAMTGAVTSGKSPLLPGYDLSSLYGFLGTWDESEPETGALSSRGSSAGAKAEAAARTMATDIEITVREVEETGRKVAKAFSEDVENAFNSATGLARSEPKGGSTAAAANDEPATKAVSPARTSKKAKTRKPTGIEKPVVVDDLKKISGIGPKLEMVLNDLGVYTFAQIAAWEAAEIAWIDDYLSFSGRIERDNWIDQASEMARKRETAKNG